MLEAQTRAVTTPGGRQRNLRVKPATVYEYPLEGPAGFSHVSGDGSGDKRLGPVREAVVSCASRGLVPVVLKGNKIC